MRRNNRRTATEGQEFDQFNALSEGDDCPECSESIQLTSGELVCSSCWLVVNERVPVPELDALQQTGPEGGTPLGRSTGTSFVHCGGLGSQVGWMDFDFGGNPDTARLQRTTVWTTDGKRKSLEVGLKEVRRLADPLNLPTPVRERAAEFVHTASEQDAFVGRNVEVVAAACVHIAACVHEMPRPYEWVAENARCEQAAIERVRPKVVHALLAKHSLDAKDVRPDPRNLLPNFATRVANAVAEAPTVQRPLAFRLETEARRLLDGGIEESNRTSRALAAGAIYRAGRFVDEPVTRADVNAAVSVSPSTLSKVANSFDTSSVAD